MTDYGYAIRQSWIKSNHPLAVKLSELRERMHLDGKALIGEEAEAKRRGWAVFVAHKGWRNEQT